jgi:hypothetical protein
MTIVGGALEVTGFMFVVAQLVRVQREKFGWPRFLIRGQKWVAWRVRRLLRRPNGVALGGASMSARATLSGRGSVRKEMGPMAGDRFAAIEFNLTEMEHELRERAREIHRHGAQRARQHLDVLKAGIRLYS